MQLLWRMCNSVNHHAVNGNHTTSKIGIGGSKGANTNKALGPAHGRRLMTNMNSALSGGHGNFDT